MAQTLDHLVHFLVDKIAFAGEEGLSYRNIFSITKQFYASESATERFRGANSKHLKPALVDDALVSRVWHWLLEGGKVSCSRATESSIDDSVRDGKDTGGFVPSGLPAVVQTRELVASVSTAKSGSVGATGAMNDNSAFSGLTLHANEVAVWKAMTGHGVDHKKVKPLEFQLLQVIASQGPQGLTQAELTDLSGQDKRSIAHRTDELHRKSYISKIKARGGSRTSQLIHKRFVDDVKSADPVGAVRRLKFLSREYKTYERVLDAISDMLRDGQTVSLKVMRQRLSIESHRSKRAVFLAIIRALEDMNVVKFIFPEATTRVQDQFYQPVVSLVGKLDSDTVASVIEALPAEFHPVAKQSDEMSAVAPSNGTKPRVSQEWSADRPLPNIIFDAVHCFGTEGVGSTTLFKYLNAQFLKRPLEVMMDNLTDAWQATQPEHLRHLAIIRDTGLKGRALHYVYRTHENFDKATRAGDLSWEAVGVAEGSQMWPQQRDNTDRWGLPSVPADKLIRSGADMKVCFEEVQKMSVVVRRRVHSPDAISFREPPRRGRPRKRPPVESNNTPAFKVTTVVERNDMTTKQRKRFYEQALQLAKRAAHANISKDETPAIRPDDSYSKIQRGLGHMNSPSPLNLIANSTVASEGVRAESNDANSKAFNQQHLDTQEKPPDQSMQAETAAEKGLQIMMSDDLRKRKHDVVDNVGNRPSKSQRLDEHTNNIAFTTSYKRKPISDGFEDSDRKRVRLDVSSPTPTPTPEYFENLKFLQTEFFNMRLPGLYINPPWRMPRPKSGRPPKRVLIVIKSAKLKDKSWFADAKTSIVDSSAQTQDSTIQIISSNPYKVIATPQLQGINPINASSSKAVGEGVNVTDPNYHLGADIYNISDTAPDRCSPNNLTPTSRIHDKTVYENVENTRLPPRRVVGANLNAENRSELSGQDATQIQLGTEPVNSATLGAVSTGIPEQAFANEKPRGSPTQFRISPRYSTKTHSGEFRSQVDKPDLPSKNNATSPSSSAYALESRNSTPSKKGKHQQLKRGVLKAGGSVHFKRDKLILELVEKAGGAIPGEKDLQIAFMAALPPQERVHTIDPVTINRAVKKLAAAQKLTKFTFAFESVQGQTCTRSIIATAGLSRSSNVVREVEGRIRNLHPNIALPDSMQVSEEHVLESVRRRRAFQPTDSIPLELQEAEKLSMRSHWTTRFQLPAWQKWDGDGTQAKVQDTFKSRPQISQQPETAIKKGPSAWTGRALPSFTVLHTTRSDTPQPTSPPTSIEQRPALYGLISPDQRQKSANGTVVANHSTKRNPKNLRIEPTFADRFEQALPSSLEDILKRPSGRSRGIIKKGYPRDFEDSVEWVERWEKDATAVLTSGSSLAVPRYINHHIPHKQQARNHWVETTDMKLNWEPHAQPQRQARSIQQPPAVENTTKHVQDASLGTPQRKGRNEGAGDSPAAKQSLKQPSDKQLSHKKTPKRPSPVKLLKAGLVSGPAFERFLFAGTIIRCLLGGDCQRLDFGLLQKLCPEYDRGYLRARWFNHYRANRKKVDSLHSKFLRQYLSACQLSEVPVIDYDALEDFDWDLLVTWAMEKMDKRPFAKALPASRQELLETASLTENADFCVKPNDSILREPTDTGRRSICLETPLHGHLLSTGVKLPNYCKVFNNDASEKDSLVNTLVRANGLARTCLREYDAGAAWKILEEADRSTTGRKSQVSMAMEKLCKATGMFGKGKTKQDSHRVTGFALAFQKAFERTSFKGHKAYYEAYMFKKELDRIFRKTGHHRIAESITNGATIVLYDLIAEGQIHVQADIPCDSSNNLPDAKRKKSISIWGFNKENYKTQGLDASIVKFPVYLVPTSTYVKGISFPEPPPSPPSVSDEQCQGRVPFWQDLHRHVIPWPWHMILSAILSSLALRPGSKTLEISKYFRGYAAQWEIEIALDWLLKLGIVTLVSPKRTKPDLGGQSVHAINRRNHGWIVRGHWWAALGPGLGQKDA